MNPEQLQGSDNPGDKTAGGVEFPTSDNSAKGSGARRKRRGKKTDAKAEESATDATTANEELGLPPVEEQKAEPTFVAQPTVSALQRSLQALCLQEGGRLRVVESRLCTDLVRLRGRVADLERLLDNWDRWSQGHHRYEVGPEKPPPNDLCRPVSCFQAEHLPPALRTKLEDLHGEELDTVIRQRTRARINSGLEQRDPFSSKGFAGSTLPIVFDEYPVDISSLVTIYRVLADDLAFVEFYLVERICAGRTTFSTACRLEDLRLFKGDRIDIFDIQINRACGYFSQAIRERASQRFHGLQRATGRLLQPDIAPEVVHGDEVSGLYGWVPLDPSPPKVNPRAPRLPGDPHEDDADSSASEGEGVLTVTE